MMVDLRNNFNERYKDKLIEKYKAIRTKKNRLPTIYDFDFDEKKQIKNTFGNLRHLCKVMGDTPKHGGSWIPDDIYFEEIADLTDFLGYPPHSEDYSRAASITNRLGGNWHDVLNAAGIKATFASPTIKVSKEEVMFKATKATKKAKTPYLPSWNDLKSSGVPMASIYLYWPSMEEFRLELNIQSKKEWEWNKREKILKNATKFLLDAKEHISIDKLLQQSELKHSQVVHIIKQYGGLAKYISTIEKSSFD